MFHKIKRAGLAALALALAVGGLAQMAQAESAFLEITLKIAPADRPAAAAVYTKYKAPFLTNVPGALSKHLLLRDDDVQVLHEFSTATAARDYLTSDLFTHDVVGELSPLLAADPEIRIYTGD